MEALSLYDLSPGKVIADRYEIVGTHRQGGLSTAFEVTDGEDDKRYEMQVFPAAMLGIDEAQDFSASLQPWKRVESDYVLRVREILNLGPSLLVLVTDFPEGESLRIRLNREQHLERADVVRIGCQLLEGLVSIHAHGLVHGDIKPYTIHVKGSGGEIRVLLVDGGVTPGLWSAKHLGEKTALIGTPYYAPVEQFGGESPDVQSDVYNVATVLFECATGTLPWPGDSFLDVFQAKLDKRPPSMSARAPDVELDSELEQAVVTGCLADRSERYATAQDFLARLSALQ